MSTTEHLALTEINEIAVRLLVQELGITNTIRFMNQFTRGIGDSVTEKEQLFGHMTVADIAVAIRQKAQPRVSQ